MSDEWSIRVARKATIIADLRVPMHKLSRNYLNDFLRALVIRYSTDTPEEMLCYYVNARRGKPVRSTRADVKWYFDYEKSASGFRCGDWECYAFAECQMTTDLAEVINKKMLQNRRA